MRTPAATIGALLGAAVLVLGSPPAAPKMPALGRVLERAHFSGTVLVSERRGSVLIASRGAGLTDGTVYDIGSVAKLFTATAVLALDQSRKLDVDAPISRYLRRARGAAGAMTARQLLTHTSGLPGDFSSDLERLSVAQAVARILSLHVRRRGSFVYSNAGYVLLAAIVQRVSHEPFRTFVRDRLLGRARLRHTGWYRDPIFRHLTRAHGYVGAVDRGEAGSRPLSWSIIGAGGMLSTAADLYRFVRVLDSGRLLDRHHTVELLRGYVAIPGQRGVRASLGGVVARTRHGTVEAVGGGTDFGFTADVRRYRPQGVVAVVLSNSDRAPANAVGFALAHVLGFG